MKCSSIKDVALWKKVWLGAVLSKKRFWTTPSAKGLTIDTYSGPYDETPVSDSVKRNQTLSEHFDSELHENANENKCTERST